jgi:hypothetical protein
MSNTMPPNKKNNDINISAANISEGNAEIQNKQKVLNKKEDNEKEQKLNNAEEILQLPLRKVQAGDRLYQGYYDEKNLMLYLADAEGRLVGKSASLKKPLPPIPTKDEYKDENDNDNEATAMFNNIPNMLQKTREKAVLRKKGKKNRTQNRKIYKIVIGVIITILIILAAVMLGFRLSISLLSEENASTEPPAENTIMVIEIRDDILPGDCIEDENLQAANIDGQTYNQIAINGNDLYRWEQKDNIIGMYATEYISKGHYITTNSVTKLYKGYENPWGTNDEAFAYADIPIDITEFDRTELLIGKKVNLKFQIEQKEENVSETLSSVSKGVKVIQEDNVTATKSYTVNNAVITNILTVNNSNLFEVYSALSAIPEGNQEHYLKKAVKYNKEYIASITPAKIRVVFDKEYIEELKKSINNGKTVEVELTDETDISTEEKKNFYNNEVVLMEILLHIIK